MTSQIQPATPQTTYPSFTAWRRATHPTMRRTRPTGIILSTNRRYVVDCLCGESASCCNDYPITKAVVEFRRQHDVGCWPDGVARVTTLTTTPRNYYGQDEADGAACRAMATALAAARRER